MSHYVSDVRDTSYSAPPHFVTHHEIDEAHRQQEAYNELHQTIIDKLSDEDGMPPLIDAFTPPASPSPSTTPSDGPTDGEMCRAMIYNMDEAGSHFEIPHAHQHSVKTDDCEAARY
ncbi:hypothetical protein P692DRAFT_20877464 [Suillus brevipes Sb2]|nr:hypothetical protein P692DRAFT_20877464 [Suillus brevipes Sb2]